MENISVFIASYLIPVYEGIYVDENLRKEFYKIVDEAEKMYQELEGGK